LISIPVSRYRKKAIPKYDEKIKEMQLNSKNKHTNSLAKSKVKNSKGSKLPREQLTLIITTRSLQNNQK